MKQFCILFFLAISLATFGQKRANIWYFGQNGAGLDFTCAPPSAISGGMYYTIEGCASVSDTLGNILFYTNGDTVYNSDHAIMPNGFGIGNAPDCWGSTTQGALIVPQPGSDSLYYIFTIDCADDIIPNTFRYSIVDMSANGGLGDVTIKYRHLKTPVTEKLAAIHHANGRDIWVVTHEHGTDVFYSYLVKPTGLDTVPVISHAGQIQWLPTYPESMTRGYMRFSPNGEKLVVLSLSDQHTYALYPELFNFDDATGVITLDYTIADPDSTNYYGASFSPDNNLLYFSGGWRGKYVHQFNANAGSSSSFLASKQVIFETTTYYPSALQMGPDGKIYIASHMWWIDVINDPDIYGAGCNYQSQAIRLNDCPRPTYSLFGLPNFIESYFRSSYPGDMCVDTIAALYSYISNCAGGSTLFTDSSLSFPDNINYWQWDFGDPSSGNNNVSGDQNPSHIYTAAGTYYVTLIVATDTESICKADTIRRTVFVDICTGVNKNTASPPAVNTYPNPFRSGTIIELTNLPYANITIYTATGKQVKYIENTGQDNLKIEFGDDLPAGVYLLMVQSDKIALTRKLVKIE